MTACAVVSRRVIASPDALLKRFKRSVSSEPDRRSGFFLTQRRRGAEKTGTSINLVFSAPLRLCVEKAFPPFATRLYGSPQIHFPNHFRFSSITSCCCLGL